MLNIVPRSTGVHGRRQKVKFILLLTFYVEEFKRPFVQNSQIINISNFSVSMLRDSDVFPSFERSAAHLAPPRKNLAGSTTALITTYQQR